MTLHRWIVALAGVVGAVGVMAAAASSHGGESRNLAAVAAICLAHGPALLALGLVATKGRLFTAAVMLLVFGTLLFAADLAVREWVGQGLFPGAAPLGGGAMILGWLALIPAGLLRRGQ